MITQELLGRFRERVNKNNFVLNKYQNKDGKNQWSCICSCMDWISVATSYLIENPRPKRSGNDDISSVNVFTYISCVDMVFEAVKQLHKIFVDSNSVPFSGEKKVFQDNQYCKDDNRYFKMIRACFGAHSVNLNDFFTSSKEKEERFASWSGGFFSSKDYGVILYSKCPEVKNISLDISFEEIDSFLQRTYSYLETLIELIAVDEKKFREDRQKEQIAVVDDSVEQLKILKEENLKRYRVDYYSFLIDELILLFETEIADAENLTKVEMYRKAILPAIAELCHVLQEMNLEEVETYESVVAKNVDLPHSVNTGFGELSDLVYSTPSAPPIFIPCLIKHISPFVNIHGDESIEELYVLAKTAFFVMSQQ